MYAVRFSVRAHQRLRGLLDGGDVAKGARDKGDIVVDSLWYADNGKCVAALAGFVEQRKSAALCAVAADDEENIDFAPNRLSMQK